VNVLGCGPSTGVFAATRASKTPNRTSLGTVLEAQTTWAFGIILASSSAPEESGVTTSSVLSAFIGSEQVTTTLPDRSPASSIHPRSGERVALHMARLARAGEPPALAQPTPSAEVRVLALSVRSYGRS
jgi:hypothetical protein